MTKIEELINLLARLRKECPWDKEQTNESLRILTIEEVYELSDAILKKDYENLEEELGDILIHIILHFLILKEKKELSFNSIIDKVIKKLIRRHPHIFDSKSNKQITAQEVSKEWEKNKNKENRGTLEGVPSKLPSIIKSIRINERLSNKGFEWETREDSYKSILAELEELQNEVSINSDKMEDEMGDILFSLVNYSKFLNINPDTALEKTNVKVTARFNYLEKELKENNISWDNITIPILQKYWKKAKENIY